MNAAEIQREFRRHGDSAAAAHAQGFFKTGPGQYAEGDVFLGIRVPVIRTFVKTHRTLGLEEVKELVRSTYHEERMLGLLILAEQYPKAEAKSRELIYKFYLNHTDHINNWDLVDCSAGKVVGAHLFERKRDPLDKLVRSTSLWERRIAIVATSYFIMRHQFDDTLRLSERLLPDKHDLIHKAVGWMLREVGKRDEAVLEGFLREHHAAMPRTALRYAIERMPEAKRKSYLHGTFES